MRVNRSRLFAALAALALLLLPAVLFAEEPAPERGMIELGVRDTWGDVYGRPDLQSGPSTTGNPATQLGCVGCGTPFDPLLRTSKYEEYRDLRNGFFIRRMNALFDNVLNSRNYVSVQTQKAIYRDQSYLVTVGQYGRYKIQFRYDEIPHVYTDTARTLYSETAPGVWKFPAAVRSTIQASTAANLPSLLAGTGANAANGVVTDFNFITPSILRKAGTIVASFNVTPDLILNGMFRRESENGTRPMGFIMNSSPSASATSGFGMELPETISYWTNLVQVGGEYGKHDWGVQAAYIGSFFEENIKSMTWDNPFLLTQPAGATGVTNPIAGRNTLYPTNHADYLNLAGATNLGKYLRFMASVTPGWLDQNEPFLPYTINAAITGCGGAPAGTPNCTVTSSLPTPSLSGSKQTLAMNYPLVTLPWKSFQIKAAYRHYDYNNNTLSHNYTPTEGDAALPSPDSNTPFGYNRKNFELSGNWFFAKRSSLKAGYEAEWMDRSHRDADHSLENSFVGAVDVGYWKDLLFRVSYRHSDRKPDAYQDDNSVDGAGNPVLCSDTTTTFFTADQRCSRRFDESARIRNRADGLVQYSPTGKLTLSAFGGTVQDDYNRPGGTNSPTPLNFLTGGAATTSPYYLYGILKDISYNYGFGGDYAFSPQMTLFAEYSHEHYYRRLISRDRSPTSGVQTILTCTGCDSANNDWQSTTPELVDIWTVGADTYVGKKAFFTTYYTLSAGRANTFSRFLGDPTITTGANAFILVGTSAATNYPEAVTRQHEVVAVFKYKLTKNLTPKFEFRYQQFDNKDPQTSPMAQYMGCASASLAAPIAGCPVAVVSSTTSATPTLSPNGPSPFYPYFQVGDPSAARYLFLGVDQPSYRAYYVSATLEYHF